MTHGKHEAPHDLKPAEHRDPAGAARGWDAADVDPSEYSGDGYAAQFPELAADQEPDEESQHRRVRAAAAGLTRDNLRTIASRTGRKVVEAWSDRNEGAMGTVVGVMLHHTGSAWGTTIAPTLQIVREGRSDLQNALCTFYIDRAGTIYLVTEKIAWHAGVGSYRGITDGNGHFLAIEAESDGVHWTADTVDAYVALVGEIVRFLSADPDTWTPRHAEFALPVGRKTDFAGLDETGFRARVAARLNGTPTGGPLMALTDAEQTELLTNTRAVLKELLGPDTATGVIGWPMVRPGVEDPAKPVRKTFLQFCMESWLELTQRLDLTGRPGPAKDTALGQALSARAELHAVAQSVTALPTADAIAAAVLAKLPTTAGGAGLTEAEVEAAVRAVFADAAKA